MHTAHLFKVVTLTLAVVVVCASSRAASAQPYATAAAGVALNSIDCAKTTFPDCDKTDIAFKMLGGYRVARWIAGEAVYLDFGEGRKSTRFAEDTIRTSGFGGGVALHGSLASWTLTARIGAARAAAKRMATLGQSVTADATFTDVTPYGGVAIGYRFSDHVALAVGFDAMRSKWARSDGLGWTWIATAATAGITIGR